MTAQILIDEAVGETRACWFDDQGSPLLLAHERWSDWKARAILGEVHCGRVIEINTGLNAAFVQLPKGENGFLPFGKKGRPKGLHEGAWIAVEITREAIAEKGPNLRMAQDVEAVGKLDLLQPAPPINERLHMPGHVEIRVADREGRDRIDAAEEEALSTVLPIAGGGDVAIEPTRAMIAVDVDTGNNPLSVGKLNAAAARLIFRQLRLRSLGGIVAIDFAAMRVKNERAALEATLRSLAKRDPAQVDVLPLSRFGVVELIRRRATRSVAETLLDGAGRMSVESRALAALRSLENEGMAHRGKRLLLAARGKVLDWLKADAIGWQAAMMERLGPRLELVEGVKDWEVKVQ